VSTPSSRQRPAPQAFGRKSLITALVIALAGCATGPSTTVTGQWKDKTALGQPFEHVLVVGVSADVNQRCPFERLLASRINEGTTTAVASCDATDKKAPLTRESIETAVKAQNADGVLSTKLVSFAWDTQAGGERDTRGGRNFKPLDSGYDYYGVPTVYGELQTAAAITTLKGEAHVTTDAWATKGPTVVYTLDSAVQKFESRDQGLVTLVGPIVERLRKDGIIR
jgi:hypothetical protein